MLVVLTKQRAKSFTLIELLVVVAIIGLLATAALVYFSSVKANARDARRQIDIKGINTAMALAYHDDNQYPLITVDAEGKITNTSIASSSDTYLSPLPQDPKGGSYYGKANADAGNRQKYCIYAQLEVPSPLAYFCASEKGIFNCTTPPALGSCCY
jgi:prepilin-type N-terminal cleavage/methylation domain-containing protein